jgi:hypothetical protein
MKLIAATLVITATFAFLLLPGEILGSEQIGIYTIVERVVLEPNDQAPERIQLWGAFATSRDVRNAKRGYMYFALPTSQQATARKEWSDFKAIAGMGRAVGFGMQQFNRAPSKAADDYFASLNHIRPVSEKPQSPDVYPLNFGVHPVTNPTILDALKLALNKP